jgi:hypothetical protein
MSSFQYDNFSMKTCSGDAQAARHSVSRVRTSEP